MSVMTDPQQVLRERFGMPDFREGQQAVIDRLLGGKNVAAVFPTGGGKSLCYQLPSQILDGTTIVVSPLLALMKDQCDALAERGIRASRFDSTLAPADFRHEMEALRSGESKILYVAPERFFNERFLASIEPLTIALFAIDEAHCISQWGHNFRPDYLKLADLSKRLGVQRVLALTATATPSVLADIRAAFCIDPEDAIRTPFHRRNLHLKSAVLTAGGRYDALRERIAERPRGATLIYVTLQKTAEEIAERLAADGLPATAYHAGMDNESRQRIQQDFINSDDQIVVATIAFGMGIDKSNIRYVYHFNPPKSLEAYAQEIGRAGRDGDESICEMLLVPEDRVVLENFTYGDTPSRRAVGRLLELIAGQPDTFHVSHYQLSAESDIRMLVVRTLLTYLELDGYLQSTSPRYDTYKIRPHVTSAVILKHFQGERRDFVASVLGCLTKGRTWFTLNMVLATQRLKTDRQRIVKALDYLAENGWVDLNVSGLVHGFRWQKRIDQPKLLADELFQRLAQREQAEVSRLDEVYELALAGTCQAGTLSTHFGEALPQPCGECSACCNEGPFSLPDAADQPIGTSAMTAITELSRQFPDVLVGPREKARFLCGLSSPAFVKSKLTRDARFGVCTEVPYATVLKQMQ
ncbi:MAG: ATP-dependent DNA helicase RecQ [Planctomycetota bacterium]